MVRQYQFLCVFKERNKSGRLPFKNSHENSYWYFAAIRLERRVITEDNCKEKVGAIHLSDEMSPPEHN